MDHQLIFDNKHLIPINRPDIPEKPFADYVSEKGSIVRFEKQIETFLDGNGAFVMTSSGKMSLYLLFKALGLTGNIITAPLSCTMAFAPIIPSELEFKFVNVCSKTFVLDEQRVEEAIDSETKAILAVHLGGVSGEIQRLRELADKHNILLIEDCAQSFGSTYMRQKLGTFGHFSCFSFAKNMWMAGGGGVYGENAEVINKIRDLQSNFPEPPLGLLEYRFERDQLEAQRIFSKTADQHYFERFLQPQKNANLGIDYHTYFEKPDVQTKPSELQAGILLEQLESLEEKNKKRIENASRIISGLKDIVDFQEFSNGQSTYSKLYGIFKSSIKNTEIIPRLTEKGIDVKHLTKSHGIHFQERLDNHPNFKDFTYLRPLENYISIHDRIVAFPISSKMMEEEIDYMIYQIQKEIR